jgi:uncharacterized protein YijF (DUF1287 family)
LSDEPRAISREAIAMTRIITLLRSLGIAAALAHGLLQTAAQSTSPSSLPREIDRAKQVTQVADQIVAGAKEQVREAAVYTPGYFRIDYPNGDLPRDRGVCTDVIVRALRKASLDLQQLIHEDMSRAFEKYPNEWNLKKPDPNIDHRRVANQMCFFRRHGRIVTNETSGGLRAEWQPGDVVCWKLDHGPLHCGIVSDTRNAAGLPLVIHNLGTCREEDCLTRWKILGHFRYPR